jgi:serralysin
MAVILGTEGPDLRNGSDSADTFTLLGGADTADGRGGSDQMNGGAGNDTLFGAAGNDVLIGSTGADHLFGGAGADNFRYFSLGESPVGIGVRDVIEDFQPGLDTIDLSAIDADTTRLGNQSFTFIGKNTFSGVPGQMRANIDSTGHLVLRMDVNGDKVTDMHIEVLGTLSVSGGDFLL